MNTATQDRFSHLTRTEYSPVEIAYMMGLTVRTVRTYLKRPSKKRNGEKLLPSVKDESTGLYVISRDNLIKFFQERYGD
jgi:hypothetical protein